jgi:hypothetical protein
MGEEIKRIIANTPLVSEPLELPKPMDSESFFSKMNNGWNKFSFKGVVDSIVNDPAYPPKTPKDKQKLRNSCVSGHLPGGELNCPYCQKDRVYALVSGYYGDRPTPEELANYLLHSELDTSQKMTDYFAVLKYLGLDLQATEADIKKFLLRIHQIDTLVRWGRGKYCFQFVKHPLTKEMVALTPPYSGKSGIIAYFIQENPDLQEIYQSAITIGLEEALPLEPQWLEKMGLEMKAVKPGVGKTEAGSKTLEASSQKMMVVNPRRPGRNSLIAKSQRTRHQTSLTRAIADVLSKKFAGVDPAQPNVLVTLDSMGHPNVREFTPQEKTSKVNKVAPKPPELNQMVKALIKRFNRNS